MLSTNVREVSLLNFYKKCKEILDDAIITDKEIDSLKEMQQAHL